MAIAWTSRTPSAAFHQDLHDQTDHRDRFRDLQIAADDLGVLLAPAVRAHAEDLRAHGAVLAVAGALLDLLAQGGRVTAHLVMVHDHHVVQVEADAGRDVRGDGPSGADQAQQRHGQERGEPRQRGRQDGEEEQQQAPPRPRAGRPVPHGQTGLLDDRSVPGNHPYPLVRSAPRRASCAARVAGHVRCGRFLVNNSLETRGSWGSSGWFAGRRGRGGRGRGPVADRPRTDRRVSVG